MSYCPSRLDKRTRFLATQDDCLHIMMEYASEGDLADLIAKRAEEKKGFTEDEIMFWCGRAQAYFKAHMVYTFTLHAAHIHSMTDQNAYFL